MFSLKRSEPKSSSLDTAIDNLCSELAGHDASDETGTAICNNIKTLCEANAAIKQADRATTVSAETLVTVAGNLAGIAMILSFEHVNVITSKALGFVLKTKI